MEVDEYEKLSARMLYVRTESTEEENFLEKVSTADAYVRQTDTGTVLRSQ